MKKQFRLPSDELEYAVLSKLWELGEASIRDLHEYPGTPSGLAYTTTAKVVDRLRDKGLLIRQRRGKAFNYHPRVSREEVEHARAQDVLRRFSGSSPRALAAALVGAVDEISPDLLQELERAIAERRRSKDGT